MEADGRMFMTGVVCVCVYIYMKDYRGHKGIYRAC